MNEFTTLAVPRREPQASGGLFAYVWSILAGLILPALIVLIGVIATLLNQESLSEPRVRLGTHLQVPIPESLLAQSPLAQLSILVGLGLISSALFCLAIWSNRKSADQRSRSITRELHRRLFKQSLRRAEIEGAAAQRLRADNLIGDQLPSVQAGLSMWYRVIPRSVLMLIGSVAVAVAVNVWLAVLAVVCGVLVWQFYQRLRVRDDGNLSHWEVPRSRQRMAELVGRAPLLARLQSQGVAESAYSSELESLYRRLASEDSRRAQIWPVLFLASATAITVILLGLGVNVLGQEEGVPLRETTGLSLPAALVLGLALAAAASSAGRIVQLAAQLRKSSRACESVYLYLQRSDDVAPSEQRVGLGGVRQSVEIHDVTLHDSTGNPILSNLSLQLAPGSLVAVLGTESVTTRALSELLMGFGRPVQGRVEIDGIPLLDIHPQALARNVMWVEPDGPLWDGTIVENLRGGNDAINNSEIMEALESVGVYEQVQRLPDGINTMVTAGDASLGVEQSYAIGIARALIHKPPVVLALEPPSPTEHLPEDPCLSALRQLVERGSLVLVLPRRLPTLRQADRVVLFNESRLVGEGKHGELLADSDLYRHLNYLLFNPYRHKPRE